MGWLYTLLFASVACCTLFVGAARWGWRVLVWPWARGTLAIMGVKMDVVGAEHLRGPAIFIANHQSLIDVVLLPALAPPTSKFVAKKGMIWIPFLGWMLAIVGGFLVDRKNRQAAITSINQGLRTMPKGYSIVVFPEGTRTLDGSLMKFKKGAFHIAIQSRMPIVPLAMEGAYDVVPRQATLIRPGTVHITVGAPIDTSTWSHETIQQHMEDTWQTLNGLLAESRRRYVLERQGAGGEIEQDVMPGRA